MRPVLSWLSRRPRRAAIGGQRCFDVASTVAATLTPLLVLAACGGSSSNTMTAPTSTTRCAVALRTDRPAVDATGTTGVLTITVNRECTWEARSDVPWIVVGSSRTGQGAASVDYRVDANGQTQTRRGHLIVNEAQVEVVQTGAACQFTLEPTVGTASASGGSLSVQVRALAGCGWTAISQAEWIRVVDTPTRDGPGVVTLELQPNPSDPRTGSVLIAGLPFTIAQAGADVTPVGPCTLTVGPATLSFPGAGGARSLSIGGDATCTWTASSTVPWLTITPPTSGRGPATLSVAAAANPATSGRTGTLVVAGLAVLVVQEAGAPPTPPVVSCTYGVSPQTVAVPAGGGSVNVTISTADTCPWSPSLSAPWLTIAGASTGTGPGTITLTAAANADSSARTATLSVAGQSVAITQAASGTPSPASCTFTVAPPALSVEAGASLGTLAVTASAATCLWAASSPVPWITAGPTGGTGSAPFTLAIAANPETTPRTAVVEVAGIGIRVAQAGAAAPGPTCAFAVVPLTATLPAAGGPGQITVTTGDACSWTVMSSAPWLTVTAGSTTTGSGTASFQAAVNVSTTPRTATLAVAGRTVVVTQEAASTASCTYTLAPGSASIAADGGALATRLDTPAACPWTAVAQVPWLQVTSPASGTGAADIALAVAANIAPISRTGTVVIGGRTFTVTQAAAASCTYALTPGSASVAAAGSTVATRLDTAASCAWTAASQASWIQVNGATTGTGPADVVLTIAPNTSTAERTAQVVIGTQSFTVLQAAAQPAPTCTFGVAPASQAVGADGGAAQVSVSASGSGCSWSAATNVPWLTIVAGAQGTGSGSVAFQVSTNPATSSRTGTLTVAGRTVEVVQAGQMAQTVVLDGPMAASSGTCPTLSFKIKGTDVFTDAQTAFEGAPCAVLKNGTKLTVDGLQQAGGKVLATRVRTSS